MQVSFWIQNDFTWLYGKLSSWTVVSGTRSSFGSFAGCHWWASLAKFSSGRTWNDSNGSMDIVSVRSCFVKFSNLIVSHNISCTDFFLKTVLGSKHFLDSRGDEEKVQKLAQMSFLPSRIKAYLTGSSSRKANQLEYRVWLRSKRWARGVLLNGILTFSTSWHPTGKDLAVKIAWQNTSRKENLHTADVKILMFDAMETQIKGKAANQFIDCRPCKKRRKRAWKRSSVPEDLRLYPCDACESFKGKSDRAGYR